MAPVKLPRDLEEDILSRVPPRSLVRFRTVSQHWNALSNDKSFLETHLARVRPQFILLTESKIYSINIHLSVHVGVDPEIDILELAADFPRQTTMQTTITACDGLLFRDFWKQGVAVWNPWLRQHGWIQYEDKGFHFCGVGYDSGKSYKILGYLKGLGKVRQQRVAVYDCSSHTLKFLEAPLKQWPSITPLSLNGNLYWITNDHDTDEHFVRSFDFSEEMFKPFCLLPCQKSDFGDELVLAVFKGDGFSLLKQCYVTGEIEIWVTKKKIVDGEEVVWISFMTLATTNLPKVINRLCGVSYFVFEKTLIMCCGDDQSGVACVYIVSEDMCNKIQIGSGTSRFSHCVYSPNFISSPLGFTT